MLDPRYERCIHRGCREMRVVPAQEHSETSVAAAERIAPNAATLRAKVLAALREKPMSDDEIQQELGMNGSTERPRRVELVRAGLVEDSGQRRKTASNREAVVWKVKKEARELISA
jgi:hypothetical protein